MGCITNPVVSKTCWPVSKMITIPNQKRGRFLGPAGLNVKRITADTGVQIYSEGEGVWSLFASSREALEEAETMVDKFIREEKPPELEFGQIYTGKILDLLETGVLIELHPAMDPMFVHNNQLDNRTVSHSSDLKLSIGQEIKVKYFGREPSTGMVRLSRKILNLGAASAVNGLKNARKSLEKRRQETEIINSVQRRTNENQSDNEIPMSKPVKTAKVRAIDEISSDNINITKKPATLVGTLRSYSSTTDLKDQAAIIREMKIVTECENSSKRTSRRKARSKEDSGKEHRSTTNFAADEANKTKTKEQQLKDDIKNTADKVEIFTHMIDTDPPEDNLKVENQESKDQSEIKDLNLQTYSEPLIRYKSFSPSLLINRDNGSKEKPSHPSSKIAVYDDKNKSKEELYTENPVEIDLESSLLGNSSELPCSEGMMEIYDKQRELSQLYERYNGNPKKEHPWLKDHVREFVVVSVQKFKRLLSDNKESMDQETLEALNACYKSIKGNLREIEIGHA